jgi:hypothetical protein
MFDLFKSNDLGNHLNKTKAVKINGVRFVIKRFTPLNYLDGSNILLNSFDAYKIGKDPEADAEMIKQDLKKMRDHFRDTFIAAVVKPALSRKEEPDKVWVDEVFQDWDMACKLYEEVMLYTYGKKKI